MASYMDALCRQIRAAGVKEKRKVSAIYVGGGTPSLAYKHFGDLKKAISDAFFVEKDAEISMECNPESVTPAFIDAAQCFGVNRVSVGVQTLSDALLKKIGRAHDRTQAINALDKLTKVFPAVSADVMIGLPGQTMENLQESLDRLLTYPLKHLSCYSLILEEGTPLFEAYKHGEFVSDDDFAVDLYDEACMRLAANGFSRYEISNFCKDDCVCRYNTSVWQYADYLGLGLGASSFLKKEGGATFRRTRNTACMSDYLSDPSLAEETLEISLEEGQKEFIMLGLRLSCGIDLVRFREIFGVDFLSNYGEKLSKVKQYFCIEKNHLSILPQHLYISNSLINSLI